MTILHTTPSIPPCSSCDILHALSQYHEIHKEFLYQKSNSEDLDPSWVTTNIRVWLTFSYMQELHLHVFFMIISYSSLHIDDIDSTSCSLKFTTFDPFRNFHTNGPKFKSFHDWTLLHGVRSSGTMPDIMTPWSKPHKRGVHPSFVCKKNPAENILHVCPGMLLHLFRIHVQLRGAHDTCQMYL